jgi:hypothetical protein
VNTTAKQASKPSILHSYSIVHDTYSPTTAQHTAQHTCTAAADASASTSTIIIAPSYKQSV